MKFIADIKTDPALKDLHDSANEKALQFKQRLEFLDTQKQKLQDDIRLEKIEFWKRASAVIETRGLVDGFNNKMEFTFNEHGQLFLLDENEGSHGKGDGCNCPACAIRRALSENGFQPI